MSIMHCDVVAVISGILRFSLFKIVVKWLFKTMNYLIIIVVCAG